MDGSDSWELPGPWRARLSLALVAGCLAGLAWVGWRILGRGGPGPVGPGASVAAVSYADDQGRVSTLGALRGQVVLVDVWATWCPPCRASLPEIARLQREARGRYSVVALSVDREGFDAIRPFLVAHPELGLAAVVPAGRGGLAPFGEIRGIPTTFVIDREGRVRSRWSGFAPGRAEAELRAALAP